MGATVTYAMSIDDLLLVGPAGDETGGIARFIDEQRRRLGDDLRVAVHDTDTGMHLSGLDVPRAVLQSMADFARFPFRRRPDVVHVHTSYRRSFYRKSAYVLFAKHAWNRPVVLHVHGSAFDDFLDTDSRAVRALQRRVFDASDAVVVLSEYWEDVLAEHAPSEKIHVVPNAVDATAYDPQFERERPHVVFLSTLFDRKGFTEFADAVESLKAGDAPPFDVTIAGTGPLEERAEQLAAEHDDVEYLGFVDEADKPRVLSSATIYVLPTYAEGLPIAILEAMAGGNAVVSTPVGAIPSVVDEANGRLVPVGDVDGLTGALGELLADPSLVAELGRASDRRVRETYSWEHATDLLRDVYRTVSAADEENGGVTDQGHGDAERHDGDSADDDSGGVDSGAAARSDAPL